MRRLALASLFAVLFVSCVRRVEPPTAVLDRAAASTSPGAHELALAGFHALLVDGDADKARTRFEGALARDPAEPWALQGLTTLALRVAHPEQALGTALDLCERAPHHPLAVVAARTALDLAGQAASLDAVLRARVPAILSHGVEADVAHLLRAALVNAHNVVHADQAQVLADMGMPTVGTLVGPFSAWHLLSLADPTAPEKTGSLDNLGTGPFGPLAPRVLRFADGRFSLSGEPNTGDVYVLAFDVTVPERTTWVLRTVTSMDHVAVLDGTTVLTRQTWQRPASTLTAQALSLKAGQHRLVLRLTRKAQAGNLSLALQRADGKPSQVTFAPATGPATRWDGVSDTTTGQLFPTATSLYLALVDEAGEALARFVAARDGLGRDHDGAARLVAGLPATLTAPALAMLRADVALRDAAVPARVGHGRANRELEAALAKDPGCVQAALAAAQLALDDSRPLDALEALARARATGKPGAPLLVLEAQVRLALGLDAVAAETARDALVALPGACDATMLLYDIARRRDAVAQADLLLAQTEPCPNFEARAAEHARGRGQLEQARARYAALLAQDVSQAQVGISLAGVLSAQRRFDEAVATLEQLRALWPRNTHVLKALGDVHEQAGHLPQALAAREAALALDGGDLALRRLVVRAKTGGEVLDADAISTEDALKSWEAAPGSEEATSTYVLDAAAIEAFADGSMVDRIHIIQKALDQQGVQDIAEVQLPGDAVVLKLRTLKPDGRTLEPESIEGKDTVSLPGVQVGDFIEYEYLVAHPSRGPGQPGFTAGAFYFQIARQPNARSTYIVRAPKGAGMAVDAHNVVPPKVVTEGDWEVFRHEERRVAPYIPEPGGPPSGNEWLPFVSVGAGERGQDGVLRSYGDAFADRGAVNWEVDAFAKDAAGDATGREAVQRVYARVMDKLSGRDSGLSTSAAASVSQDRGSRVWLLVASLRALGFDARVAAVRTFTADPAPYLFPADGLANYVCVVVRLPQAAPLWLDAVVRYAPFGELPEIALGGREAWLLPEPGHPSERLETPKASARVDKRVQLTMQLSAEGVLSGDGVETFSGFEAAQLRDGLDTLSPEQRDQALQSSLSRYFGGADLSGVKVDSKREVGGEVTLSYRFVARRFARVDGNQLVAGALTFPHMLGRRYLATPTRTTPLFIDFSESSRVTATVTLPAGFALAGPVAEAKLETPAGRFVRAERQDGQVLTVTEDFRLAQARIAPKDYEAFAQFAGEVDLLQQRDLQFERR